MRRVEGFLLWIGTARDARAIKLLLDQGIEAVVDLAVEEIPLSPTRELVYLRFPLLDGTGNPSWLLRMARQTIGQLMEQAVQTLVACSAGMSRSPALVAAALARIKGLEPAEALVLLQRDGPHDVSPGLWRDLLAT